MEWKKWWYDGEKTILTDKEVAFGTGTFYKQNQELVEDLAKDGINTDFYQQTGVYLLKKMRKIRRTLSVGAESTRRISLNRGIGGFNQKKK